MSVKLDVSIWRKKVALPMSIAIIGFGKIAARLASVREGDELLVDGKLYPETNDTEFAPIAITIDHFRKISN